MSEVILHGVAPSSYVRTCRLALDEKGVAYTLDPAMPQTPEQLAHHPWGKIPALTHDRRSPRHAGPGGNKYSSRDKGKSKSAVPCS